MTHEEQNKRSSIPSTSTNESSSNGSNRCIRNNSYLNANHTISLLKAAELEKKNLQNKMETLNNLDLRPSSSSSSNSSSNSSSRHKNNHKVTNKSNNCAQGSQHHLHQVQLEIINEAKNGNSQKDADGNEILPDYASYEITV